MTSMVVRTISTVWRSVMALVSSRGAVPKTSVEMACGASGCRNHSVKAAIPAWATSPIQERFSGGMARYHGSVSSIRAMAWAARLPDGLLQPLQGRGVRVDVVRWALGVAGFGFGHGTRLPYPDGAVRRRVASRREAAAGGARVSS